MPPSSNSSKVLIGPTVVDGGVSRAVELSDGTARVETWDGESWRLGGATFGELATSPPASTSLMNRLAVPMSDRSPGELG